MKILEMYPKIEVVFGKTFVIRIELFGNLVDPTNGKSLPVVNVLIISSLGSLLIVFGFLGNEITKSLVN